MLCETLLKCVGARSRRTCWARVKVAARRVRWRGRALLIIGVRSCVGDGILVTC